MSLFRQSILVVTALIASLLVGNLYVSVNNARDYLSQQMQVHAEDAATSLAFSLSRAAQENDQALLSSMVDIIFDRGYYRLIEFRDLSGKEIIRRELPVNIEGVPSWFVNTLLLPEPQGRAEVVSGWYRLGELKVISHPGYAYRDLWRVFVEQLQVFLAIALLCYLLVGLGLRFLFRPLKLLELQADAISRREFPVQEQLPKTPELRSIVVAMNRMVMKLKDLFQEQVDLSETLHRQSWVDSVTGLPNRRDFDARLDALTRSERGGGAAALLLLHVDGLQILNDAEGRESGDDLLAQLADIIREQLEPYSEAIVARRSGADFSVLLPALSEEEVRGFMGLLLGRLRACADVSSGVAYTQALTLKHQLLPVADLALRQAQGRSESGWAMLPEGHESGRGLPAVVRQAQEWREFLQDVLTRGLIQLHFQPLVGSDRELEHFEILCRLPDGDDLLQAGVFWPMLERFNLALEMDQKVIELVRQACLDGGPNAAQKQSLCVNLSPSSVLSPSFFRWLDQLLADDREFAERLLFEVPETCLATSRDVVQAFAQMLVSRGAGLSLDHFGLGIRAFSYLQSLPLTCLKVDQSFIRQLPTQADNQFFVRSLVQIARSCDIAIYAEGIETEEEWKSVLELGLNGGQGYYLGEPRVHKF